MISLVLLSLLFWAHLTGEGDVTAFGGYRCHHGFDFHLAKVGSLG